MAQLVGLIVSDDDNFRKQIGRLLRSAAVPISVIDDGTPREGSPPDVVIVDIRSDASSGAAVIERLRGTSPGAGIFAVAAAAEPELILQAMRAGANEFFTWPPPDETFARAPSAGPRRAATWRRARSRPATDAGVLRRQGRRRHDDGRGELRRRDRAAQQAVDRDRRPQAGPRRGGAVPRRPAALHACSTPSTTSHRLDREFLRELVAKHKSGLEILAGSDQFDRPGAADGGAIEELFRLLAPAVRATSWSTRAARSTPARSPRCTPPTRSSWWRTPTCRRSGTRSGCSTACGSSAPCSRARPGAAEPRGGAAADSAEADRDGARPSASTTRSRATTSTVSTALNSGVPLALDRQLRDRRAVRPLHARSARAGRPPRRPPSRRSAAMLGFASATVSIW